MDHHEGIFRHNDRVTGHRNQGCHRGGNAIHIHGNGRTVIFQGIKNGDAFKDIATR